MNITNNTKESLQLEELYEYPHSIREFLSSRGYPKFDKKNPHRNKRDWLKQLMIIPYDIQDREYGGRKMDVSNLYLTFIDQPYIDNLIKAFIEDGEYQVHPYKKFERWDLISKHYYGNVHDWWVIPLFNKISDPFDATLDFNILRIPFAGFVNRIEHSFFYNFRGGEEIL